MNKDEWFILCLSLASILFGFLSINDDNYSIVVSPNFPYSVGALSPILMILIGIVLLTLLIIKKCKKDKK